MYLKPNKNHVIVSATVPEISCRKRLNLNSLLVTVMRVYVHDIKGWKSDGENGPQLTQLDIINYGCDPLNIFNYS